MSHTSQRPRPIVVVGGILLGLAFAGFIAARLTSGPLVWLNAWHQPVSVFLLVPALAVLLAIGVLSHFVWRPSQRRRSRRPGRQ